MTNQSLRERVAEIICNATYEGVPDTYLSDADAWRGRPSDE